MFKVIVLISAVVCITDASIRRNLNSRKIGGGYNTRIEDYPYQVALITLAWKFVCGGSIISANYILTAAHCVARDDSVAYIRAGSSSFRSDGELFKVSQTIVHPSFDYETKEYDLCLLKLDRSIQFGSTMQPIPFIKRGTILYTDTYVTISGWGKISEGSLYSPETLQVVNLQIIDQTTCTDKLRGSGHSITNSMFCAGRHEDGYGACRGDSGGPAMIDNVLVGVFSWVVTCNTERYPTVFARVSAARDWIDSYLNTNQNWYKNQYKNSYESRYQNQYQDQYQYYY